MNLQENRVEIEMVLSEAAKMTEEERAKLCRVLASLCENSNEGVRHDDLAGKNRGGDDSNRSC